MTSKERIKVGRKIAHNIGVSVYGNGCVYPIGFETPLDNDEDCTDLSLAFDRVKDYPLLSLPLSDWQVKHLLSQIKEHKDFMAQEDRKTA